MSMTLAEKHKAQWRVKQTLQPVADSLGQERFEVAFRQAVSRLGVAWRWYPYCDGRQGGLWRLDSFVILGAAFQLTGEAHTERLGMAQALAHLEVILGAK